MTNQRLLKRLELGSGETVRAVWRRWWLTRWWRWLLMIVAVLLPFFLLYPLLQWPGYGPVAFAVLLVVGVSVSVRWWWQWYGTVLVLTNRRVIDCDQRGLFDRVLTAAAFDRITDVHFRRKGVWQTILGYGTIEYTIVPGQTRIITPGLRRPAMICQTISQTAADEGADPALDPGVAPAIRTATELRAALVAMHQTLGPEHFADIVASVDPDYQAYRRQRDNDAAA